MRESMMHLQELQERGLRDADRTMLGILQRKSEKGNGRSE
jgi:hypothetical protein